jgi:hypothetical protein
MSRGLALSRSPWLISITFCALALALRGQIANDAFWLDEIWSYYLSRLMESPWDALSELRHDNNHPLNTLLIYWMGEQANWSIYRLPALLSGVATVALMGPAARLLDVKPWLAMLLGAISIPLIQYSAEARGYSAAALFGLTAWYVWYAHLAIRISPGWLLAFWASCVLGMLSHMTFIFVLAALGMAFLWNSALDRQAWLAHLREAGIAFTVPLAFTAWMYFYLYGRMSPGGEARSWKLLPSLLELSRVTVGAPETPLINVGAAILLIGLLGIGIISLPAIHRRFFSLIIGLVPALLLTIYQPDYFYPRYLLVCLPFAYLVLGRTLTRALDSGGNIRLIAAALILAIVGGSGVQYIELARWGKGDFPQAVADLYAAADSGPFTVGSDFDFRNHALLDFYSRYRKDSKRLTYIDKSYDSAEPTDFFIAHNLQPGHTPQRILRLKSGRYRLLQQYPFAGLSGWNWYLYQHEYAQRDATQPAI